MIGLFSVVSVLAASGGGGASLSYINISLILGV